MNDVAHPPEPRPDAAPRPAPPARAAGPGLLRQPTFMRFWAARVLSNIGFQMLGVVVGWQIYDLTRSTFDLGMVGLVQFLPMLVLTLPVGHVADRYDRRRVAQLCQLACAVAAMGLALVTVAGWLSGPTAILGTGTIFAVMTLVGAARSFESPTVSALLPSVVIAADLPAALAISSSAIQTATIVGPALGGFLYVLGPALAYAVLGLIYAAAALLMGSIGLGRPAPHREPPTLSTLLSGFVFIRDHAMVLGAISLDLFAVLLGGATALLPVYARDILVVSPIGLGVLRAAPAIGALAMAVVLARHPLRRRAGLKMFAAVAIFGMATIVFGLSRSFFLSLGALAVLGAADVVSVVVRSTLVQIDTPDAMRGRVSAVNSMFVGTSNQLGEFESGATAALFGTVPAVVLGGVGTILVALVWARLFPSLRRVDDLAGTGR